MELRKLRKEEHGKTRRMWEQIFAEDTPEFLDYYYSVKTSENEIYVIEDSGTICAMLQLNPYKMQIGKQIVNAHYIVAVATDEKYRRQGLMGRILKAAQRDMKKAGEPFTFLMPAAEGIYYPHGFRYIYRQKQGKIAGKSLGGKEWEMRPAERKDCAGLADFANRLLEREYDVFARRDSHYYEILLEEQKSENGGIALISEGDKLAGYFFYAKGEEYEIREPLFLEGDEEAFAYGIYELTKDEKAEVKCLAYGAEEKPMIMAKILDIPRMFQCMEAEQGISLDVDIYDEPDGEFLGRFMISGKGQLQAEETEVKLEAASEGYETEQITIGLLTSLVFGYEDVENQDVSEHFKEEWRKIKPLRNIFLNEIV